MIATIIYIIGIILCIKAVLEILKMNISTAGKAITLPRILLCVAAAAAVLWVQIFFYKKRKKAA